MRAGDASSFTVDGYPLITYHFSGTGPTGNHRRIRQIFDPGNGAVAEIERLYEAAIARHGQAPIEHRPPGYDVFDDGTPVTPAARRIYRQHADLRRTFPDPYACPSGQLTYRSWLRQQRTGVIDGLKLAAHRLAAAFTTRTSSSSRPSTTTRRCPMTPGRSPNTSAGARGRSCGIT